MRYQDVCTLIKKAKKQKLWIDDTYYINASTEEDREAYKRIRKNIAPMSFGEAFIDSAPAALLAAAIGGAGSMAMSKGSLKAGAIGAAVSGLSTAFLNALSDAGKSKMSVEEAIANQYQ